MTSQSKTKKQLIHELVELRKQNAELKASDTGRFRLKEHFNNLPLLGYNIGLDGKIVDCNTMAIKTLGYKNKRELIGKPLFTTIYAPSSREKAKKVFLKWKKTGKVKDEELQVITKQGEILDVLLNADTIYEREGKPLYSISTHLDITERKQTEEILLKRTHDLGERVKELNCLFGIDEICRREMITIEEALKEIVQLIPISWQYSEVTEGCISFEHHKYKTKNYRRTRWIQTANIIVSKRKVGLVQVCYLKKMPESDEDPFLKDEKSLINAMAEKIGQFIDKKRSEEALRKSEARFRVISDYAYDWITLRDKDGSLNYVSPAFERITGHKVEDYVSGKIGYQELFHSDDYQKADEYFSGVLRGDSFNDIEFKMTRKDRKLIYISASAQPVTTETGEIVGMRASMRDITERKRILEDLRDSNQKLRKAQRVAKMGFLDRNIKTNEMYWSDEVYRLYGIDPKKTKSNIDLAMELVHPDDLEFVQENLDLAIQGVKDYDIDHRVLRPDGKAIWVHAMAELVRDAKGNAESLLGTVVDITPRKEAEEALKESEERFRRFYESDIAGFARTRVSDGKLLDVNDYMVELLGYEDRETCLSEYLGSEHYVDSNERKRMLEELIKAGRARNFELPITRRDGSIIWVSYSAALYPEEGCIEFVVFDITDRKRAEQEKEKLQTQLVHSEKMAGIGTLTGGIAHEFNNLLQIMRGHTEFALRTKKTEDIEEALDIVMGTSDRVSKIIGDLLTFSRLEISEKQACHIIEPVESVLSLTEEQLKKLNINVVRRYVRNPKVKINKGEMQQVFLNLIMNARDVMISKGGRLTIEVAQVEENAEISFTDNGMGMEKAELSKVFEPFYTTKGAIGGDTELKGTGLGLSVSYGIVKRHGGTIEAKSGLGKGATFTVKLPVRM